MQAAFFGTMRFSRQSHNACEIDATRAELIMQRWNVIQQDRLPELGEQVGSLTPKREKVIQDQSVARSLTLAPMQISPGMTPPPSRLCLEDLRHRVPYKFWALTIIGASPQRAALYPFPVRQASALPSAASRFAVARDPLGASRGLILQVSALYTERTTKKPPAGGSRAIRSPLSAWKTACAAAPCGSRPSCVPRREHLASRNRPSTGRASSSGHIRSARGSGHDGLLRTARIHHRP